MKSLLKLVLVTLFSAAAATSAVAQMGAKPVTLVVPYGAGGTSDIMARIMSAKMQTVMPHPVIADNKPGAGGRLAVGLVKNMAADGSVVLVGLPAPIVVAPTFTRSSTTTSTRTTPLSRRSQKPGSASLCPRRLRSRVLRT